MTTNCHLILDDGSWYPGTSFGASPPDLDSLDPDNEPAAGFGEVVFATSMSGYHETLTDPSYTGQLLCMTYPHAGNYGCDPAWNESGPETPGKRPEVKSSGMIVRDLYRGPVPAGRVTLDQFLRASGVPGISGVDTRQLTLRLRDGGARNGVLVGTRTGTVLTDSRAKKVAETLLQFAEVVLLPSNTPFESVRELRADALFLSNGPGDPAVLADQISFVKSALARMPVLGICLGHQLIALGLGAKTYKMRFGHHGINHPVRDALSGRVFVTSQNHGFAVDEESLPDAVSVWLRNANDGSVEGLRHRELPVASIQFHPEAAPGPLDARGLFDSMLTIAAGREK